MIICYVFPEKDLNGLIIARGFVSALSNLVWVMTDEIFPSQIKARCYGYHNFCGKIGAMVMPLIIF